MLLRGPDSYSCAVLCDSDRAHAEVKNRKFDAEDTRKLMDSSPHHRRVGIEHARSLVVTAKMLLALEKTYGLSLSVASARD